MDFRFVQEAVKDLLEEFPGRLPSDTAESLMGNIQAGEPELTFDALCDWLYELDVEMEANYFAKLDAVRAMLDLPSSILDSVRGNVK